MKHNKLESHDLELSTIVASLDEAGAGCGFGPVVAAAVILPNDIEHPLLNDSKKVTEKNREILFDFIIRNAIDYSIQEVDALTIDRINILQSRFLAMDRCVKSLSTKPKHLLIDGNRFYSSYDVNFTCVVKGDSKYKSIAAASILAKVHRDRLVVDLSDKYNLWDLKKHKGYLTKRHIELISINGLSELHRVTFCEKFLK